MAGFEPLVVLGLVCNIIQLVGESYRIVQRLRQIKDNSHIGMKIQLEQLRGICHVIDKKAAVGGVSCEYTTDLSSVEGIAKVCSGAVKHLTDQIDRVLAKGTFGAVIWMMFNKGKIAGLEKDMSKAQDLLQLGMVIKLV